MNIQGLAKKRACVQARFFVGYKGSDSIESNPWFTYIVPTCLSFQRVDQFNDAVAEDALIQT